MGRYLTRGRRITYGTFMSTTQDPAIALFTLADRLGLTDDEIAAASGLSPHTIRLARATRQAPRSPRCQAAFASFVERNAEACTRGDVRLAARR